MCPVRVFSGIHPAGFNFSWSSTQRVNGLDGVLPPSTSTCSVISASDYLVIPTWHNLQAVILNLDKPTNILFLFPFTMTNISTILMRISSPGGLKVPGGVPRVEFPGWSSQSGVPGVEFHELSSRGGVP